MTLLRFFLLHAAVLVAIATTAHAQALCSETLKFSQDGSIAGWEVCHHEVRQTFAVLEDGRLGINASVGGRSLNEELLWQRTDGQDGEVSFRAVDAAHSLEIVRSYHRVSGASLVHTIAVRNLSAQAMSGVWLSIETGGRLLSRHDTARSLADYVYGFHRVDVAVEDGRWHAASTGGESHNFALTSRHKTLVIDGSRPFIVQADGGSEGSSTSDESRASWLLGFDLGRMGANETRTLQQKVSALPTETRTLDAAGYNGLMYADLWRPLAILSQWIERIFVALSAIAWGPGFAVILLATAIRLITLPVSLWSARRQREFVLVSEKMKPAIAGVKANYKGAEQSERILAIYKENRVSPFSGLKGSVGLFVQIPFLLAVFNVTTVSSIFSGANFLWIEDLSLPDTAAMLPVSIAMLGNHLNALPIMLGIFNLSSSDGRTERSRASKAMSAIITLLVVAVFYSFAAALVLYWLTVNVIQAIERRLFRPANEGTDELNRRKQ
ncbi:MAG: YidC/Oxa1 family membrane protein insertase [Woeseia sp.]